MTAKKMMIDQNELRHAALEQQLLAYQPFDDEELAARERILEFVRRQQPLTYLDNQWDHLTAGGWLLSPDGKKVLLTHHQSFGQWLQLGGHVEAGEDLLTAALRESKEESGIDDIRALSRQIFDLDVHHVPAEHGRPPHYHYDIRFLLQANTWDFVISDESDALAWFLPEKVANPQGWLHGTLKRMVAKWQA